MFVGYYSNPVEFDVIKILVLVYNLESLNRRILVCYRLILISSMKTLHVPILIGAFDEDGVFIVPAISSKVVIPPGKRLTKPYRIGSY